MRINADLINLMILATSLAVGQAWAEQSIAEFGANKLIGQWARSVEECAHPELSFTGSNAVIYLEADGSRSVFKYPSVSYKVEADNISVELKERHPFSKTASKTALEFKMPSSGEAILRQLNGRTTAFVRCK